MSGSLSAIAAELPPPNIRLIMAEDMGPRVGAFGDPVAVTPNQPPMLPLLMKPRPPMRQALLQRMPVLLSMQSPHACPRQSITLPL